MRIPLLFALLVFSWATMPLALVWSVEDLTPVTSAWLRTTLALILGLAVMGFLKIPLDRDLRSIRGYMVTLFATYGGLLLIFYAGQHVTSGVISIAIGCTPIFTALIARQVLREQHLGGIGMVGVLMCLIGLCLMFSVSAQPGPDAYIATALLAFGVLLFSFSIVLTKKVNPPGHPLAQAIGALLLSQPLFALSWFIFDGNVPTIDWTSRSLFAVVYMAIMMSLVGYACYFYLLKHLPSSTVTLGTYIAPLLAIFLGYQLNNEEFGTLSVSGGLMILLGLFVFRHANRWDEQLANSSARTDA